jgi:hypothetical protein
MRFVLIAAAMFFAQGPSHAEDNDTLVRATAHYADTIYATVVKRIADDIDKAQLTDEEASDWLDAIVGELASCQLAALEYLGPGVRDEVVNALASGASKQTMSQIISKNLEDDANIQATLATYSDVRQQCTKRINQRYGINYY